MEKIKALENIATQIRRENQGIALVAPERVNRDRTFDASSILAGLGAKKGNVRINEFGEIERSL